MPSPAYPASIKAMASRAEAQLTNGSAAGGPIRNNRRAKNLANIPGGLTSDPSSGGGRRLKRQLQPNHNDAPPAAGEPSSSRPRPPRAQVRPRDRDRSFAPHPLLLQPGAADPPSFSAGIRAGARSAQQSSAASEDPGLYRRFSSMAIAPVLSVERLGDVSTWASASARGRTRAQQQADRRVKLEGERHEQSTHGNGIRNVNVNGNGYMEWKPSSNSPQQQHAILRSLAAAVGANVLDPPRTGDVLISHPAYSQSPHLHPRPGSPLPSTNTTGNPSSVDPSSVSLSAQGWHFYASPQSLVEPREAAVFPSVGVGGDTSVSALSGNTNHQHQHVHAHNHWGNHLSCCGSVLPSHTGHRRTRFWFADEEDQDDDDDDDDSDASGDRYGERGYSDVSDDGGSLEVISQ